MDGVRLEGSMSNTANGIYTHKKFNRGTSESSNGKDVLNRHEECSEQKLPFVSSSALDLNSSNSAVITTTNKNGFYNGNSNFERDLSNATFCSKCNLYFGSKVLYLNHDCKVPRALKEAKSAEDAHKESTFSKVPFSRSFSLPLSNAHSSTIEITSLDTAGPEIFSPSSVPKHPYKPKFRAQYSLQENNTPVICTSDQSSAQHQTLCSTVIRDSLKQINSSVRSKNYPSCDFQTNVITELPRRQNTLSLLCSQNAKQEDIQVSSKANVQSPSPIWKGIKSPSPEVLGQHITNLIVQNQAIVETPNPLWSLRSKRQISSISSQGESDATQKRRYITSENTRGTKLSYSYRSREGVSDLQKEIFPATIVPSLPRASMSSISLISPVGASKLNISSSISSPLNSVNYSNEFSRYRTAIINTAANTVGRLSAQTCDKLAFMSDKIVPLNHDGPSNMYSTIENVESLDLSKKSRIRNNHSTINCSKCNAIFPSMEQLEIHLNKHFCEQEVALDLQKKNNPCNESEKTLIDKNYNERAPSRESTFSDPGLRVPSRIESPHQRGLSASPNLHRVDSFPPLSPPKKKRKIVELDRGLQSCNQNNNHSNVQNYSSKMLDELIKPKTNSHHIYGGEVQICDGNAYKTLKIDSMKNEGPSLDLCIASQQLTADSEKRANIPTSLVVTITKSGLNSGGTMVKIESQKSSNYKSISSMRGTLPACPQKDIVQPFSKPESPLHLTPIQYSPAEIQIKPVKTAAEIAHHLQRDCLSELPFPPVENKPNSHISEPDSGLSNYCLISDQQIASKNYASNKAIDVASFPKVVNFGQDSVPFVPGIPGPYSQASPILVHIGNSLVTKSTTKSPHSDSFPESKDVISLKNKELPPSPSKVEKLCHRSDSTSNKFESEVVPKVLSKTSAIHSVIQNSSAVNKLKLPEIRVEPPLTEDSPAKSEGFLIESKNEESDNFLIPRKRPSTLLLKPQQFSLKSSLSLIGSTLVSPDTPRPKKSCVQLFLNGSAYTYLNLKVSTKTFFCCIYRPQPMYVIQSPNSKLSMYSNWQVRKTEDPFKLSPSESMSLYKSCLYYDRAYTLAKPKSVQLSLVPSSYIKKKTRDKKIQESDIPANDDAMDHQSYDVPKDSDGKGTFPILQDSELEQSQNKEKITDHSSGVSNKNVWIRIFEGGFKTNEEYTYVRGRGRGRYVCETCGIRCKKPSMLKKHIRTHTDLRPFSCRHCSFSFKTKGNLTKHLKSKAHFKRCTEMGIIPVPTSVDESHINLEAIDNMQFPQIKPSTGCQYMEEDDEEEFEDDEEDDEEDLEDDEEDDEEEFLEKSDQDPIGSKLEKDNHFHLGERYDDLGVCVRDSEVKTPPPVPCCEANSLDHCFSSPKEDSLPIDLSLKRSSVITSLSIEKNSSADCKAYHERPNFLPISSKSFGSSETAKTPIKEHPSEILSPVTESSMILKSIYNTTFKVSSTTNPDKGNLPPELGKETGSSGFMLQTYLKERYVLDSTRKRQYLYSSSAKNKNAEEPSHQPVTIAKESLNQAECQFSEPMEVSLHSTANSDTIVAPITVIHTSNNSVVLPSNSSINAITTNSSPILSLPSDKFPVLIQSSDSQELHISAASSTVIYTNNSNAVSTSNAPPKISSSASKSNGSFVTLNSNVSSINKMPTAPGNMTVINSCRIDSKTTFIAPSGVIPTNNRMEDDGKCTCSICNKEFAKRAQLSLHMNIHFIERPHRCESCGISFRTSGHLQKHKRSVTHFNKVNMNMTFGTPSTENPRPFKCRYCKVAFRIHGHLAKHLRSKLHIMKLECVGKLPFGTYAEIERSGSNLNEIDTSDCENSLESLLLMAARLYEKDPAKLSDWENRQQKLQSVHPGEHRVRTVSNSSNNSEDYPLMDDQDVASSRVATPMRSSGEDSDEEDSHKTASPLNHPILETPTCEELQKKKSYSLSKNLANAETSLGSSEGIFGCPQCPLKFSHYKQFEVHFYTLHEQNGLEEPASEKSGLVSASSPPLTAATNLVSKAHKAEAPARSMNPL